MIGVNHSGVCCKRIGEKLYELVWQDIDNYWWQYNDENVFVWETDRGCIDIQRGYARNEPLRYDKCFVFNGIISRHFFENSNLELYLLVYDVDRNPYWIRKKNPRKWAIVDAFDLFYIELAYKQGGIAKNEHTYQGEGEQFSSSQKTEA